MAPPIPRRRATELWLTFPLSRGTFFFGFTWLGLSSYMFPFTIPHEFS